MATRVVRVGGAYLQYVPTVPTPHLPWDLPDWKYVDGPQVMPHYFTAYPLRLTANPAGSDTTAGHYYQNYVAPGTVENGTDHRRYGGLLRDFPLQGNLQSTTTTGWELADMKLEVRRAIAAGMTGWCLDMLSIRGYDGAPDTVGHWTRVKRMFTAVEQVNVEDGERFRILLMPDGTSGSTAWVKNGTVPDINASADALANAVNQLASSPAMFRTAGKLVVGPYGPELWPRDTTGRTAQDRVQFWMRFVETMGVTYQDRPLLWFCYVDAWTGQTASPLFDGFAYGHGRWGDRDANAVAGSSVNNRGAAAYCHDTWKKPWMHFGGTPMDSRPVSAGSSGTSYRTWEGWGTRALEGSWLAAIEGGADFNQVTTWNDLSEHAHVCPTRNLGHSFLDLQSYWATRFRAGYYPPIVRDGLYLTHRVQRTDATLTANTLQTAFTVNGNSGTPFKNEVELLVFATAAATAEIRNNGEVIATQAVPAGMTRVTATLPASGLLSGRLVRSGVTVPGTQVTAQQLVKSVVEYEDMHYRSQSSLRQLQGTS